MLLMANLRHDMDDITLKNDMCLIKIDRNIDLLLAALLNDLTVPTMENGILHAKTLCAKLLLPSLYNCYGNSKHNGSPAKVCNFKMILTNCAGDMSKLPNTILFRSKGRIVSRLHKEIMALKGKIPRPSQDNNHLTFKRMMMLVVKKRKLSAAKNEMLSDGPKSVSPETIKGAIEKLFPSSLEDTRVGDNLT
jgi:hypothetical protein